MFGFVAVADAQIAVAGAQGNVRGPVTHQPVGQRAQPVVPQCLPERIERPVIPAQLCNVLRVEQAFQRRVDECHPPECGRGDGMIQPL